MRRRADGVLGGWSCVCVSRVCAVGLRCAALRRAGLGLVGITQGCGVLKGRGQAGREERKGHPIQALRGLDLRAGCHV